MKARGRAAIHPPITPQPMIPSLPISPLTSAAEAIQSGKVCVHVASAKV